MSWHPNPTTCLKLENKCVLSMSASLNVISASAVLPLWSDCLPTRHRWGPNPPCCTQHGGNKRTEHEELPYRRVVLQLTGRSDPSPAHALPTTNETLREEVVRITCTTARHIHTYAADVRANSRSRSQHKIAQSTFNLLLTRGRECET